VERQVDQGVWKVLHDVACNTVRCKGELNQRSTVCERIHSYSNCRNRRVDWIGNKKHQVLQVPMMAHCTQYSMPPRTATATLVTVFVSANSGGFFHRKERIPDPVNPRPSWPSFFFFCRGISHIRQNLRFSSPAPVHTMSPPGLRQLNNTRDSCASLISATRSRDGYACTMIALVGYPCVVRNSFLCGDHCTEVTCAGNFLVCNLPPVVLFQIWTLASFVPPPLARRDGCHGHHARAYIKQKAHQTALDGNELLRGMHELALTAAV
jgi:hypothetical protein